LTHAEPIGALLDVLGFEEPHVDEVFFFGEHVRNAFEASHQGFDEFVGVKFFEAGNGDA
jgi:hypothetical protein